MFYINLRASTLWSSNPAAYSVRWELFVDIAVLSAVADAIGDGEVTFDGAFDCGLYIASTLDWSFRIPGHRYCQASETGITIRLDPCGIPETEMGVVRAGEDELLVPVVVVYSVIEH